MTWLLLVAIGLVIIFLAKLYFGEEFNPTEIAASIAGYIFTVTIVYFIGSSWNLSDYKTINGVVTEKEVQMEYCKTGWNDSKDSFCTEYRTRQVPDGTKTCTKSDGVETCKNNYKTQYKYVYPWEKKYQVRSTHASFEIKRVDSQGADEPHRYTRTNLGDPVASLERYNNYVRAAASTLLNQKNIETISVPYPAIYDYYMSDRVIFIDKSNDLLKKEWNTTLALTNSKLKDANAIIFVTGNNKDFPEQLTQAWDAHKINDVVIVIGTEGDKIEYVDVRSWSANDLVNLEIRDAIMRIGSISKYDEINSTIETSIGKHFVLQSPEDFEYLKDDMEFPTWAVVLIALLAAILLPIAIIIFSRKGTDP